MSHGLLVNQFVGKKSAWHYMGHTNQQLASAVQAVNSYGMAWKIAKTPLFAELDGVRIGTDTYGLIRPPVDGDDQHVLLGTCSDRYEFHQNDEIASLVDLLIDRSGWELSTVGVLQKGATIFFTLGMPDFQIGYDEFSSYFAYSENRNGKDASSAMITPVKIVCQNTHALATKRANAHMKIPHHRGYQSMVGWALQVIADANNRRNDMVEALNELMSIRVTDEEYNMIVDRIVPLPTLPKLLATGLVEVVDKEKIEKVQYLYDVKANAARVVRKQLIDNFASGIDTMPDLRGTGWHAFQAVTHFVSNQYGTLGTRGKKATAASRAEYDLLGAGMDMRNAAYNAIIDLA